MNLKCLKGFLKSFKSVNSSWLIHGRNGFSLIIAIQTFLFWNTRFFIFFLAIGITLLVAFLADVFWNRKWLNNTIKIELQSTYVHQEVKLQWSVKFCMKLSTKKLFTAGDASWSSRIMAIRKILGPWNCTYFSLFFYINEEVHGQP